jgi:TRAP-type C4-dicarboxylate transport system permease small subunit
MRFSAMFWVALTTFMLLTVTIFSSMDLPFDWVFYLTVLGQVSLVIMVYKVLTDNYSTDLEFRDGYQDRPLQEQL